MRCRLEVLFGLIIILLFPLAGYAQERQVVVLPLTHDGGLSESESSLLVEDVREAVLEHSGSEYVLVDKEHTKEVLESVAGGMKDCEESCVIEIGRKLKAHLVIAGKVVRTGETLNTAFRLFDVKSEALVALKISPVASVSDLEQQLSQVVKNLFEALDLSIVNEETKSDEILYADIHISAQATRAEDDWTKPEAVKATVSINGVKVGTTPYRDGLPAGQYLVELNFEGAPSFRRRILVIAGQVLSIEAQFRVPITDDEIEARRTAAEKEKVAQLRRELEAWQKKHNDWEQITGPVMPKRRAHLVAGGTAILAGLIMTVTGSAYLAQATKLDQRAEIVYEDWLYSNEPDDAEVDDELERLQSDRDRKNIVGIVLLSIGGAVTVGGIVTYVLAPKIEREPKRPASLEGVEVSTIRVMPSLSLGQLSLTLECRF